MRLFEKIKENKWKFSLVLIIVLIGIFLRSYHFSSWLHFEIDQTYDAQIVSRAVENGPSNLPLLGPTAGGGRSLRLGPAFYYMEYLSGLAFGNTPTGYAILILILSVFSLPLFYFFCRQYFSFYPSLGLLAIFSTSLYLVRYSRFSWSPNVLPFLVLAFLFCLLKSVSKKEQRKEAWFLSSVAIASVASQIHFISFFSIPLILVVFLLIKRPHFRLKIWAAAAAIFIIVYSPMIISDIKTHGQNFSYFSQKLGLTKTIEEVPENKEDPGKKMGEKLFQDARYSALEYYLVVSGIDKINNKRYKGYDAGIFCKSCKDDAPYKIGGFIFFAIALILMVFRFFKEKEENKKNFLELCILWFFSTFLFLFLITYDGFYIYPRFFLLMSPLAIIFLGFILEGLRLEKNIIGILILFMAVLLISFSNLKNINSDFRQLRETSTQDFPIQTEDVFPDNERITLEQQMKIVSYLKEKQKENGFPIYIKSIHEFDPVFWYQLEKQNMPFDELKYGMMNEEKEIYREGNYFLVLETDKETPKEFKLYSPAFDISQNKEFGSLTVFELKPKTESITQEKQDIKNKKPSYQEDQIKQLLTWKKLFN